MKYSEQNPLFVFLVHSLFHLFSSSSSYIYIYICVCVCVCVCARARVDKLLYYIKNHTQKHARICIVSLIPKKKTVFPRWPPN